MCSLRRYQQPSFWLSWWRHQMEIFSALLAICAGNSPVPVNSPHKGQWCGALMVVFFYLRLNKRLSKQSWGCWFETLPRPLWRHSNGWINTFQASTCFTQGRISLPQCREIIENKNISLCILKIFQHIGVRPQTLTVRHICLNPHVSIWHDKTDNKSCMFLYSVSFMRNPDPSWCKISSAVSIHQGWGLLC